METMPKESVISTNEEKQIFTHDEVTEACMKYFDNDDLATQVWMSKYAVKDSKGNYCEKEPSAMHARMAKQFARIETQYGTDETNKLSLSKYGQEREPLTEKKIFNYFDKFKYIVPQGSVMASLGNPYVFASLSNCIVLPEVYDSYGGILFADQQLTQLMKRRCGVGVDISTLRPERMSVSNSAGSSSGAVSFMERFSNTTREVAQSGRRGALMVTIDVKHPDVEKFVSIKSDLTKVTGANISVKLGDDFMRAVKNDEEFTLKFPVDSLEPQFTKTIPHARTLWNEIVTAARNTAEPGLIFWDRQHWYSTSSVYPQYKNISTNPCAEIAMGNDSCRLIAINLFGCVEHPFTPKAKINFKKLYEITYESQRLMDNLVDLELEAVQNILNKIDADPEPDYIKSVERKTWQTLYDTGKKGRRTGLGFTALADAVAALGIKFDTDASLVLVEEIMKTKCRAEFDSSIDMAIERGSFDGFDTKIENTSEFVQMLQKEMPDVYERMMKFGRRNVSISTVAPNGSLSMLTQTSSGVEPVFMLSYKRRRKINAEDPATKVDFVDGLGDKWQEYEVFHPKLKLWKEITGETDVTKSPYFKATAEEIDWVNRVELQSVIQKYITHSISSTINLPETITTDKVAEIYLKSWEMGLKGITVYRANSRSGVLVASDTKPKEGKITKTNAPKRPEKLPCDIHHVTAQGNKWIVIVGLLNGDPYEIFSFKENKLKLSTKYKQGVMTKVKRGEYSLSCDNGDFVLDDIASFFATDEQEALTRMISTGLRHGSAVEHVVAQLDKAEGTIVSFNKAIARTLKKYIAQEVLESDKMCTECKTESMVFEAGCKKCSNCGYSACG